jgi:hypothetical protein
MLELRKQLVSLVEWEAENFPCIMQTEIDAVAHRIIRMAELLKRMREIAEQNLKGLSVLTTVGVIALIDPGKSYAVARRIIRMAELLECAALHGERNRRALTLPRSRFPWSHTQRLTRTHRQIHLSAGSVARR